MPPSCKNGFQATVGYSNTWHWIKVQEVTKYYLMSCITRICFGKIKIGYQELSRHFAFGR